MQIAGIGRIIVWEGGSLWIGAATATIPEHAHHAIQLGLALRGEVRFRPAADGAWTLYQAAIIPADLGHAFDAVGSLVAHVFVEPESRVGRAIRQRFGESTIAELPATETRPVADRLRAEFDRGGSDAELVAAAMAGLEVLTAGVAPARPSEPRIVRAIGAIKDRLDTPVTLGEIAGVSHLSPGRFRHLFVAETGLPFRTYVLWLRLDRAIAAYATGGSWTEAAHAANFADSAHLTRTLRRMFGLAPSSLRIRESSR